MPYLAYPRCFLSVSFAPEDRNVFKWFEEILGALDFAVVTGESPEPRPPIETVRARIGGCQAIVGVLTRRDPVGIGDSWKPPQSVCEEVAMAFALGKTVCVLVEEGVDPGGMIPEATTFVRWNREGLAASTPQVIRYLVSLRAKLAPPFQLEGDIPTARALALELSGIGAELQTVTETQSLDGWHLASLAAVVTGRLMTLPATLVSEVQQAYGALTPVREVLTKIDTARESFRPKSKLMGVPDYSVPLPSLPPGDALLDQLAAERDKALGKVRRAALLLYRFGWPEEWKSAFPALIAAFEPGEFRATFGFAPDELKP